MSEEAIFYNQTIWSGFDKFISSSSFNVDKFVVKEPWGTSPPRIRMSINNYKAKANSSISLTHQEIFVFLQQFKKFEDKISAIIKEISEDQNKQHTFSIKNKKNLFVTFMHRSEYNGTCMRLVISEKNNDYLDSEKIYLPIMEFLSLVTVLGQFRNNYLSTVDSMTTIIAINDMTQKISSLDEKLTSYYSEFSAKNKLFENDLLIKKCNLSTEYNLFDDLSDSKKLEIIGNVEQEPSSSTTVSTTDSTTDSFNPEETHNEMSNFINDKRETFDLGIGEELKPAVDIKNATIIPATFTEKMLNNDLSNLEMYITNLINDDLPFSKFSELIKMKLNFDALEGISNENINGVDYLSSLFMKSVIKDNLNNKKEIPNSVLPIIFDNVTSNENKISLAYDLCLYCIYYSHIRNILKDKDYSVVGNKELMSFALKVIASPYVFSYMKLIDEKILCAELVNRYRRYRTTGVFDNVEKQIKESKSITILLSEEVIKTEAARFHSIILQQWNNLTIESAFKNRSCILNSSDFSKNKLSKEQIKKILMAEFNFRKNKQVNFKEAGIDSFEDIPLSISEKFGIMIKKYDNTNLKRFVKDQCKDNADLNVSCMEIINSINESFKDLKDKVIDYSIIPENVLKAIILWDLKSDTKLANNYIYLLDQVKKSSLSKDMIISMLLNISDTGDSDFTNSFIASRDE
jgi:hypothetical protein